MLGDKPNLPPTNPPAPEDRMRPQEKQKDQVTDYYPPSLLYIASYEEEDTPNLVNNLVAGQQNQIEIQTIPVHFRKSIIENRKINY